MQRLSLVLDYGIRVNARQILLRATATDLSQPKEGRSKCEVGVLPLAQPQAGVEAVAGVGMSYETRATPRYEGTFLLVLIAYNHQPHSLHHTSFVLVGENGNLVRQSNLNN